METLTTNTVSNKDITVTYQPKLCIHAEKCAKGLSDVFRTDVLPWINLEASDTQRIIKQIRQCPSGALQYCKNKE